MSVLMNCTIMNMITMMIIIMIITTMMAHIAKVIALGILI